MCPSRRPSVRPREPRSTEFLGLWKKKLLIEKITWDYIFKSDELVFFINFFLLIFLIFYLFYLFFCEAKKYYKIKKN